jgi:putative transport protein
MHWLLDLHRTQPVAHAWALMAAVCVLGMALGSLRLRASGSAPAGVLFAGILVGHLGEPVVPCHARLRQGVRLILFCSRSDCSSGPASSRRCAPGAAPQRARRGDRAARRDRAARWPAGSWASTPRRCLAVLRSVDDNTPSLGAGSQALGTLPASTPPAVAAALGLRVTYPTAINRHHRHARVCGVFRVDVAREAAESRRAPARAHRAARAPHARGHEREPRRLRSRRCGLRESGVTIARVQHGVETRAATHTTLVRLDDRLAVVDRPPASITSERAVGRRVDDTDLAAGALDSRRLV